MTASHVRYFALVYGIVFLLVGIAGFVPGFVAPPEAGRDLTIATGFGRLFSLFPVNLLHNLVHVAFGIWGLAAYRSFPASRTYARAVAVIYGVLTVMGLIPVLATTFGLIPLYGHDVWLHALLAVVAAYFGWAPARAETAPVRGTPTTGRIDRQP
jgi:hypothetical protein